MNKIVLLLGVIVLAILAMIFFCIGFFTGSNITPSQITAVLQGKEEKVSSDVNMTEQKIKGIIDEKSVTISDKILGILNSAGSVGGKLSNFVADEKIEKDEKVSEKKKIPATEESAITIDSLLREIVSSHSSDDDCSHEKTIAEINNPQQKQNINSGLYGKSVAFVGYFKNNIAVQIQKLLTMKGYHAHVERSKSGSGDECFIFCGPFKKDSNARKLVEWLQEHDFSDARVVSITKEAVEETLFDAMNDDTDMPKNEEYDVLEANARARRAAGLNNVTQPAGNYGLDNKEQQNMINGNMQQKNVLNQGIQQNQSMIQYPVNQASALRMNQIRLPQMR